MKITFLYKGHEYFIICRSYEYSNKCSWFYLPSDVKWIRGKVTVTGANMTTQGKDTSLMGYTNFTEWL